MSFIISCSASDSYRENCVDCKYCTKDDPCYDCIYLELDDFDDESLDE